MSGLTDGDLWRLDIFEGDEYERRKVKVRILEVGVGVSEEEVEVETYVWVAGEEGLEEGEWDFEEFTREKMGRWVGNEEYGGRSLRFPVLGVVLLVMARWIALNSWYMY